MDFVHKRIPRTWRRLAVGLGLAGLAAVCLLAGGATSRAEASWLIDQAKFHIGAHGSLSCADCHDDISLKAGHPDPGAVNRKAHSFFRLEQCAGCHGDVVDDLEKGTHAGKPLAKGKDYRACVTCHNPHYVRGKEPLPKKFDAAKPVAQQCGACHAKRDALPPLGEDAARCLSCHKAVDTHTQAGRAAVSRLCLSCHGPDRAKAGGPAAMATMDAKALAGNTHGGLSCLDCHSDAARFGHADQTRVACRTCHTRHDEKVTHDAHADVTCEACHLGGATPRREWSGGRLVADLATPAPGRLLVHGMALPGDESSCRRCHFPGNALGAAAMVLPAKGLICMPCHAATFSVSDPVTSLSLLVLLVGVAFMAVFWFSRTGLGQGASGRAAHGGGHGLAFGRLCDVFFWDVLLQRRLLRESPNRWFVHALIFFPFLFRFLWGLAGLLGSLWTPGSQWPWWLLDKNSALGAFLFDVSGLVLLAGCLLAACQWRRLDRKADVANLPRRDWLALWLLGAIVVVGFVLEGMRMAMTGFPTGSGGAFAGAILGWLAKSLMTGQALSQAYGYVWYAHAILTGLTVAYLPFSQLRHVVLAPVVMLLGATKPEHGSGK